MVQGSEAQVVRFVDEVEDVRRCFGLIAQLRSQLTDEQVWLSYWERQHPSGYLLAVLLVEDVPTALASCRIQENLVHGRFLYAEDLISDANHRGRGHGETLISFLRTEARKLGCRRIVLDTALTNQLGHRFYFRCGLLASSLRFVEDLAPAGAA